MLEISFFSLHYITDSIDNENRDRFCDIARGLTAISLILKN